MANGGRARRTSPLCELSEFENLVAVEDPHPWPQLWGASPRARLPKGPSAQRCAAQGAGEGNTTTQHPRGGAVLRRREEHPLTDPEIAPGPASGIPRMRLALSKSTCGPQVRPGNGRCALLQIRRCQVHLVFQGRTWHLQVHLQFHGRTGRYRGAPAVHGCTLGMGMPGAPCFK
jgi:hypothetical protein